MESLHSAPKRCGVKGNDQKDQDVSTIVKSEQQSSLLQRRPSLQEHCGAIKVTTDEKASSSQEEETSSDKMVCSEKSSSLANERTAVEVDTSR